MKNRLTIAAGTVLAPTGCSSAAQPSKNSSASASASTDEQEFDAFLDGITRVG
ncbi:hypothetical protein [Propionibacterium acidifaciens]|uniref:hypothetical protein n=1 Tax=Propionibacterium acidifaciens TaxID=556499 RepID=UPI000407ABAF|nr:hypothetical protein [Propionibacterium acidifaciens]